MADSNAIKAGEAYVSATVRNDTKAGLDAANKDIASATAKMTDAGKATLLTNESAKRSTGMVGEWAKSLVKVTAAIWAVKQAYHALMQDANDLTDKQIEKANELGDAWRKSLGRDVERRNAFIPLGSPEEQAAKTKSALDALNMSAKAQQLSQAQKELDDYNRANRFGGDPFGKIKGENMLGLKKSDIPIGFGGFNEAELKIRENSLKNAKDNYKQASDAAEEYRQKLRELAKPEINAALVGQIDAITKALKLQIKTFNMSAETVDVERMKAMGATPDMIKEQQNLGNRLGALQFNEQFRQNRADLAESIRGEQDDMYWKRRQAEITIEGGKQKGMFGANIGSGSFDFGGGGSWQGIGVTLKDMKESELRIERLIADANRKLGDFAQ